MSSSYPGMCHLIALLLLLPALLLIADFIVDECPFFALTLVTSQGIKFLLIPRPCLVNYVVSKSLASEPWLCRCLERLPQKTVFAATNSQLRHLKSKGCVGDTTTRVQLLSLATAIRLATAMKLPASLVKGLQARDPCLSAAPPAAGAPAAAARAVGMSAAEALAALRGNQAAAAAAGPSSAAAGPSSAAAAATPQAQASARPAGQIPEVFPAVLPLVDLTTEELHRSR